MSVIHQRNDIKPQNWYVKISVLGFFVFWQNQYPLFYVKFVFKKILISLLVSYDI